MKRTLLLVLLLGLAVAGSALTAGDFSYEVRYNPLSLDSDYREVLVAVPSVKGQAVFGVVLGFDGTPGVISQEDAISIDAIEQKKYGEVIFHMSATSPGTYDLSEAFEIISWDDSVSLTMNELPETTSEKKITLRGQTDAATLCAEHQYAGFWAKQENCQVKITINNEEYWAERSGSFAIDYELGEGQNRIDISARDPGGNTEEKVAFVTYTPSIGTMLERNILIVVVLLVLLIAGAIGLVVYWKSRHAAHEDLVTESLEELRDKQRKLFMEFARRTGVTGRFDEQTGKQLLETFAGIVKKDVYYSQPFADKRLAIKEREDIFRNDRVTPGVRNLLLERYVRGLEGKN